MTELCDTVHAFADGELTREEADAFRAHLATCTRCQAELADILQLSNAAALLKTPAPQKAPEVVRLAWYRRGTTLAAAIALPIAATILAAILIPREHELLPAYAMSGPSGYVEGTRGVTATSALSGPRVFIPDSILQLKLLPARPVSAAIPVAGLFVADPGGALVRVKNVDVQSTEQGSFAIRAGGRAAFGDKAGKKTIYAVIAPYAGALDALDGADPRKLEQDRALRFFSAPVEYRLSD